MSKVLVLGINGQDGSYLAELLVDKGKQVIGWVPTTIPISFENIQHILSQVVLVEGDLSDQDLLTQCLEEHHPDEIYNLASPSSPSASWDNPVMVSDITGLGVTRLLEAVRQITPQARYYQASTSELFGIPVETPQDENTPFHPRNPYGIAKLYAHWVTVRYRERYGLHAVSGILFNHESPRRGYQFVTRKITRTAAHIKLGHKTELRLGDLEARRDWGFAGDYVHAMHLMLNQDEPQDYVIGTGETHSVREFCELAFGQLDMDYQDYVIQDQRFIRPGKEGQLVANPSKARRELNWHPTVTFSKLIQMMVEADLKKIEKGNIN